MSIIITLFVLGIVIFVHELGHMIAAKKSGVGVNEFAVGMGPKLYAKKIDETEYFLRAFPFGGFVKLAGMDDEEGQTAPAELDFRKKPLLSRLITISAGSVMNIILGFLIFILIYSLLGVPEISKTIDEVFPQTPAYKAGLLSGDKIISINGKDVLEVEKDIVNIIKDSIGKEIKLTIKRKDRLQTLNIIPKASKENEKVGLIGIKFRIQTIRYNPVRATVIAFEKTLFTIKQVFWSFKMLLKGEAIWKDVAGPIGIIQLASFQLKESILSFFNIMAIISISLGIINLFPFPVLDGGHLVFLLIEAIIKKPVNKKIETYINNAGAIALITLMAFIVFNDIWNWGNRVKLLENLSKP